MYIILNTYMIHNDVFLNFQSFIFHEQDTNGSIEKIAMLKQQAKFFL